MTVVQGGSQRSEADYVEAVLSVVEQVPAGRVTTYGRIAELVRGRTGRGGPRSVGRVLADHGGAVDWFRVVRADGRLPPRGAAAAAALAAEGVPVVDGRVTGLADRLWPDGAGARRPDRS